jgi:O-antigen ligase
LRVSVKTTVRAGPASRRAASVQASLAAGWERWGPVAAIALLIVGLAAWALGSGFVAFWSFVWAAVAVALVLPLPYAVVSPLFMGVAGWLVNMLPLLILVGWTAVVLRWVGRLTIERRLPHGGLWKWIPIGLVPWTALGVVVVPRDDIKHFILLFGMQVLVSGGLLLIADAITTHEARIRLTRGLVGYVVLLSCAVLVQWTGVDIQALQNDSISNRLEAAYGVDAFTNDTGMIKYTPAKEAGAGRLRRDLRRLQLRQPALPRFVVFRPRFKAFDNHLVVRFAGSARAFEEPLERRGVELVFDNVGLAPMNTVPRLRSFPRNALTYAGICAATFPLALAIAWTETRRRRRLGWLGVAACLFGAAFSIARGAWAAILVGIVYLILDGVLSRKRKALAVTLYVLAAAIMTGFFLIRYDTDPLTSRALGESSITTREELYSDTIESVSGISLLIGHGTELSRTAGGGTKAYGEYGRYIPPAGSHSTYLNYLFRTGIVGAAMASALYLIAWLHARTAARVRSGKDAVVATLTAAAVVTAAAHAIILSLYVEPAYTLTVTIVLGVALAGSLTLPSSILPWRASGRDTGHS